MQRAKRKKLTKTLLDGLKPKDKIFYVWDSVVPGLAARVMPTGRIKFVLCYRVDGKQRWPTIGEYGPTTLNGARAVARKWLGEVATGADPSDERQRRRHGITLSQLWDEYQAYAETRKKASSRYSERKAWERSIREPLGDKRLDAITSADIERLMASMSATPYQANRIRAQLNSMFGLAKRLGFHRGPNPVAGTSTYKERRRERFLTPEELARIGAALAECERNGTFAPGVVAAFRLLLLTGCRLREILNLTWAEVDLPARRLRLKDSKTGPRQVVLNAAAIEIFDRLPRHETGLLFPQRRTPEKPISTLRPEWLEVCKLAGVEDARIHDLRHALASVAVGEGVGLPLVAGLLGHTRLSTTERYSHLHDSPVEAASELVGRAVSGLLNGKGAEIVDLAKDSADPTGDESASAKEGATDAN